MAAFLGLLPAAPASAYIDPGAGSLFVQVIVGLVVSALAFVKFYWRRLGELLRKLSGR